MLKYCSNVICQSSDELGSLRYEIKSFQTLPTNLVSLYVTTSPCHFNRIRTHNHLVCKQTLNHLVKFNHFNHLTSLAKWLSVHLQTKWLWIRIPLQSLKLQILRMFEQGVPWHSVNYRVSIHPKTRIDIIRTYSLLVILAIFLNTFTWIHFVSTFISTGTSLVVTESHTSHITQN